MKAKKEKIKVTVTTEEVTELEICFPYYTKGEGIWCKFLSISVAMWVTDYSFNRAIDWSSGAVPERWITFDPITEKEFNAKFNEVMTALIDIKNEKTI